MVFFQTLVPTLREEPAREVKATFLRLAPTLVRMAWAELGERRDDGERALRQLETLLLEVASVHLAPAESELLFRSLDQLSGLIVGGQYALAQELVTTPLLGILRKNRVARSLFRLMEVEVAIQAYLKERLGYETPRLRLPEDVTALSAFGPVRVFEEEGLDGERRCYLQLQLPDIPILNDIVVHLAGEERAPSRSGECLLVVLDEPGVQRQPPAIRGLHPVGDHHMGMQLRIQRPAGVLPKGRRHNPLRVDHRHRTPDAVAGMGMLFDPGDHRPHRRVMSIKDNPADAGVTEREQHRHRFRCRRRHIKPAHRLLVITAAELPLRSMRVDATHHRQKLFVDHVSGKAELLAPAPSQRPGGSSASR